MILQSNSVLGFNLFKRTRLKVKQLSFELSDLHCDDIGLYVIGKYPNLEYNFVSLFQKKEWDNISLETLNLAILNLIVSGTISVYGFEDEKSYVGGLFKVKTRSYYFKIEDVPDTEDLLTKALLSSINVVEESDSKVKDLKNVIRVLLNDYLGEGKEHNRPEKKFIVEILKRYSKKYNWLKIVSKKKMLGLYKDHKIELERIYIPRIDMQHQALITHHTNELRNNSEYVKFRYKLREVLKTDFTSRVPSDDTTD